MTYQYRAVCAGRGKKHALHRYERATLADAEWTADYLTRQAWTKPCRPFTIEARPIGEWEPVGQLTLNRGEIQV